MKDVKIGDVFILRDAKGDEYLYHIIFNNNSSFDKNPYKVRIQHNSGFFGKEGLSTYVEIAKDHWKKTVSDSKYRRVK